VLRIFIALKGPSPRPCLNPRPLGPVTSTLTTTPPRRRTGCIVTHIYNGGQVLETSGHGTVTCPRGPIRFSHCTLSLSARHPPTQVTAVGDCGRFGRFCVPKACLSKPRPAVHSVRPANVINKCSKKQIRNTFRSM
jgi:hypothetical protein